MAHGSQTNGHGPQGHGAKVTQSRIGAPHGAAVHGKGIKPCHASKVPSSSLRAGHAAHVPKSVIRTGRFIDHIRPGDLDPMVYMDE